MGWPGAEEREAALPSSERVDLGRLRAAARTLPERQPTPDAAHAFRPEAEAEGGAGTVASHPSPPFGGLEGLGGPARGLSGAGGRRGGTGAPVNGNRGRGVDALVELALEGVGLGAEGAAAGACSGGNGANPMGSGGIGTGGPEADGEGAESTPGASGRAIGAFKELRRRCRGRGGCDDVVGAGGFRAACRGATSPDKSVQVQALGLISAIKQHLRGDSEEAWLARMEEEWLQSIEEEPAPEAGSA